MRAILLSGGTGTRLGGDIPKQYLKVNDRMIIEYSIETLAGCKDIESLVIVADEKWQEAITAALKEYDDRHVFSGFAAPGETRQWSIYNGLLALKGQAGEEDSVLIHDAARPKLKETLIKNMGNALKGYDGVLPVLPMKDTVYKVDGTGKISALLERKEIMAGQAPELFLYGKYLKANEQMIEDGRMGSINGSTEPAFLAGMDIVTIPGDEDNYKITTVRDLERFRTEC
ncbi:2-C-methyl-D-erythritol 4-phosphate cytidylyltransferase [Oribacterium sp. KHPX15]|uniref:IspD/TarI family cytidylyltransferase n=1 Tax=Oribacterium sp. KHPX15 TaxID=1855342 RepID=UPI000899E63A|nr:IspD/TarI family cytidylyltransferase [Oribacterium sp. KHPX15]SEA40767.1 2-C-methyl-D-erythritol 4-phosphate cytidylyltransferase [Oribacterium sp. KHPX15]